LITLLKKVNEDVRVQVDTLLFLKCVLYWHITLRRIFMLNASLRRSGGSLIMTIPQSYVEQNNLDAGSRLFVEINGTELKVQPCRQRPKLSELLASTPDGLSRACGWEEMPAAGAEL
jgi:antitoxin ChpS